MTLLTNFVDGPIGSPSTITVFIALAIFGMALLIKAILPSNENRERKFLDWNSFTKVPSLDLAKDNLPSAEFLSNEMCDLLNDYFDKLNSKNISKYTARFCIDWTRNYSIFRQFIHMNPMIVSPTHYRFLESKKEEVIAIFIKAEQKYPHQFHELERYMVNDVSPYLERRYYDELHRIIHQKIQVEQ